MTPDGAIRKAIVDALEAQGVTVTEQVLPISATVPTAFVEINAQSRQRTAVSKQNYEWECNVTLSLVKVNEKGYISSVELDSLDTIVCKAMDSLTVPGFRVALTRFFSSDSDSLESPDNTINRRHIQYEIWVNRKL